MFSKLALFTTSAFVLAGLAVPTPGGPGSSNSCNVGELQCCQSVQSSNDASVAGLLGLLGVFLGGVTAQVGLTCNPISVIGVGSGANCNAQPVCCENNNFNGLVAIGCTPVAVNL